LGVSKRGVWAGVDSLRDALPDMTDHEHLTWEGAWDIHAGFDGTVAEHMHMIPSSLD